MAEPNPLPEMILRPVGMVENSLALKPRSSGTPSPDTQSPDTRGLSLAEKRRRTFEHQQRVRGEISRLILYPEFEELLEGIEDFSHLLVLFWPHQMPEGSRELKKVHPMGIAENPPTGIFATRSPARPNPVLMTETELLEREGRILRVRGLDALNQSPIIDIKPIVGGGVDKENLRFPQWLKQARYPEE